MRTVFRALALSFATFLVSSPVHADTLTYNFLTSNTPDGIISTSLPASPTPLSFTADSFQIIVPLIVDGDSLTIPVNFFTAASGGGASGEGVRVTGPTLFSGLPADPTFLTGTFAFGDFTLTVTPQPSAVPEPSTLFLFGSGLIAGGLFIKRRIRLLVKSDS